jgi:DNA-binding beta-propeller fold protein YncE
MKKCKILIPLSLLLTAAGCNDSTEPSSDYLSRVTVISTSSTSIVANFDLEEFDCEGVAVSPDGEHLYIWGFYAGAVARLNSSTGEITGWMECDGFNTIDLVVSATGGELYLLSHNCLYFVSAESMQITDTLDLGLGLSWSMVHRPGTELLYIQRDWDSDNGTIVVDVSAAAVTDTLSTGSEQMEFSPDGGILYLGLGSYLSKIDPETGDELLEVLLPGTVIDLCAEPGFGTLYVSWAGNPYGGNGGVSKINPNNLTISATINEPVLASNLCCVESEDLLFVSGTEDRDILVIDLEVFQPAGVIEVEEYLYEMVASPDEQFVYAAIFRQDPTQY